jgi:hypothetical protein
MVKRLPNKRKPLNSNPSGEKKNFKNKANMKTNNQPPPLQKTANIDEDVE